MKIRERLIKALFGNLIEEEIQKSSRQIVSYATGPSLPSEGLLPEIDFDIFEQTYRQTSWVRAAVSVIVKAVIARGYSLVPARSSADPKNAEVLQAFFENVSPNDTLGEILSDITRDCFVFGNAFVEIVRGLDGKPKELWSLDTPSMRIDADEHGQIRGYIQIPRFSSTTQRVEFQPGEVMHIKLETRGSTLYGLSPLASLILPITCDRFAMIYNRAFFMNGAKVRGAFVMRNATAEQVERNREYMKAKAQSLDQAHSDLLLEGDIEFKQISVPQKDMEFLDLRKFTRDEILAVYGVPPSKVSVIETGNIGSGTGEHQTQTFYEETVVPFQMLLSAKITKSIIRDGFGITDWSFQFNKRSIDARDEAEIFSIYLQNGVFKPEEVRSLIAPRMPEIQKYASGNNSYEITKKLVASETIVNATREVVAIENRFVDTLARLFREIKNVVASKLHKLRPEVIRPKVAKIELSGEIFTLTYHDLSFRFSKVPDAVKQVDELEVIIELIDQDKIARAVEKYSLEAARKGLKLSAQRSKLEDVEELSSMLEENLRNNAVALASHVSESLKSSLRQALIEGIAANETIPQLIRRIENQLDSIATINVRPVIDEAGNILRSGSTRKLERATAAELIARTEANRAFNEGNLDALKQAGIEMTRILISSDACPQCLEIAQVTPGEKVGRAFAIDEAENLLPIHPNCRCTMIGFIE